MSNDKPLVSVIVPVYNVEQFLPRCVESIINQTQQKIELILVDDGSPDSSGKICDDYAAKDSRIKVIHVENGGPAKARNLGMDIAEGDYIGFVDSDDYISPEMYNRLYAAAVQYDADIAMCNYYIDSDGLITPTNFNYKPLYKGNREIRNNLLQSYYTGEIQGLYSLCIKIFKKNFIQDNKLRINEQLKRGEDSWFNYDALRVADSFAFISDVLYFYVQNETSIMHTPQKGQYEQWVKNRQKLLSDNHEYHFQIDYNRFYAAFLYKVANYCRDLISNGEASVAEKILMDDFYREVAGYSKRLPYHIRLLHSLGKNNPKIAINGYKLWNLTLKNR